MMRFTYIVYYIHVYICNWVEITSKKVEIIFLNDNWVSVWVYSRIHLYILVESKYICKKNFICKLIYFGDTLLAISNIFVN